MTMPYEQPATVETPALVVFVLDVSASMGQPLGDRTRLDVVVDTLRACVNEMVRRSTRAGRVLPRYRVAMFAYSDNVDDLLGGVKPIDWFANQGAPVLSPERGTDTAKAFASVADLLARDMDPDAPAPLVCHLTDGEFTGDDPGPMVNRVRGMSSGDGPVLIENVFIGDGILAERIDDPKTWPGVLPSTPLNGKYASRLREFSSPLPASYRRTLMEQGFCPERPALLLFPADTPELVELAFATATAGPGDR